MATAVTTEVHQDVPEESRSGSSGNAPLGPRGKSGDSQPVRSGLSVWKPGEGYATRLGLMVVVLGYMLFAAHQFYYNWVLIRSLIETFGLGFLTHWTLNYPNYVSIIGTMIVAGTGLWFGYFYIYINPRTAEFLIKTDTELGKVTWPKVSPWFRPETQVWGSTYVVLIVVLIMTAFVFGVDVILKKIADFVFYAK